MVQFQHGIFHVSIFFLPFLAFLAECAHNFPTNTKVFYYFSGVVQNAALLSSLFVSKAVAKCED